MRINLSDVEVRDFEPLPAGRYIVKLTDYDQTETKGREGAKLPGGTPMINWEFTVKSDAKSGDEKYAGRKLWMNTILHERTMAMVKGFLVATGIYTEADLNSGDFEFEPDEILEQADEMVAVVRQREYEGETRNDVRRMLPISSAEEVAGSSSMLP
jgi:hypothetical protein